jgi:hypothetical protein
MKALLVAALLAVLSPTRLTAQSASPSFEPIGEKVVPQQSIGVLIGLDRLYDSQIPTTKMTRSLEDEKSAAYRRQRSKNKDGEGTPLRYDTTSEESPYATVWLHWTPAGMKTRLLRDIILPRKDGFWRFGINHSSVNGSSGNDDEDFFWLARLGTKPALTRTDENLGGSLAATRRVTYVGPDYFSYRELGQSWGGSYGESESAFVRSLDEFANAPPKEADYQRDHAGLSLAQVLGSGAELEFMKITKEEAPIDSDDAQSKPTARSEDEDPCAGSAYITDQTDWYLSHSQGRWIALLALQNTGPGKCSRQTDWKPLTHPLPSTLVGHDPIPVPWAQVEKVFPGARHAFASPKGDWLVVLTRNQIYLAPLRGDSIGRPEASAEIPYGIPVATQWALGKYVSLWEQQLSTVPRPNDDVFFTFEPEN